VEVEPLGIAQFQNVSELEDPRQDLQKTSTTRSGQAGIWAYAQSEDWPCLAAYLPRLARYLAQTARSIDELETVGHELV
jgi:hypothetical protein